MITQHDMLMVFLDGTRDDPSHEGIKKFHADHEALVLDAKGSKSKHQAWKGGYLDHLVECMQIGHTMFYSLSAIRPVGVTLASVVKVLYFHDVEKMFKYSELPPPRWEIHRAVTEDPSKKFLYEHALKSMYKIEFTADELNALENIHGEKDYGEHRVAGPLAAFCHCCDMLSARLWHDKPTKEEKGLS